MISRRVFLAGSAVSLGGAAFALSGCDVVKGPQADATLEAHWALAIRDIEMLSGTTSELDPNGQYAEAITAALHARSEHEGVLSTEIRRVCGTYDDGSVDEECIAKPAPAAKPAPTADASPASTATSAATSATATSSPASSTAAQPADSTLAMLLSDSRSSASLLDSLAKKKSLSEDYETLLAAAIDGGLVLVLRAMDVDWEDLVPRTPLAASELHDDLPHLTTALTAEFALIYGMGVAAPRITEEYRESTVTSADRHRQLRDNALAVFTACNATPPVAEPGYIEVKSAPQPEDDAAGFAAALEGACATAWRTAVMECKHPQARLFALQAAGISQAGAEVFAGNPEAPLPGMELANS
ncbi:DUF4439 domain-containing protein [Corynebacterium sp. H113]|uniref:DUF4439 domain-containing protein n=1 Tax=Corynebacterium sp. H113 TaxID=3133419 RepID=UPI0030A68060